jgi:hypothetical protein
LRAPGRTETPELAIQNNTINKIRGEGSHLTGFVRLTPSPCLTPNRQSARLRPALVELQAGTSGSHLTGFVGLTPSPRLSTNRQFTPPKGRLLPSLSGQYK